MVSATLRDRHGLVSGDRFRSSSAAPAPVALSPTVQTHCRDCSAPLLVLATAERGIMKSVHKSGKAPGSTDRNRLQRRRIRPLMYGAASLAILVPLAACTVGGNSSSDKGTSGASGSTDKGTLSIEEWTNQGAIDATKEINALFEKQHPGVKVKIVQAPTANNAWQTLTASVIAAKSVDILAQFAPTQSAFPPAFTKLAPSGTAALIKSNQLTDLSSQPFMKSY